LEHPPYVPSWQTYAFSTMTNPLQYEDEQYQGMISNLLSLEKRKRVHGDMLAI
jgi:hypothetical protein